MHSHRKTYIKPMLDSHRTTDEIGAPTTYHYSGGKTGKHDGGKRRVNLQPTRATNK